MTKIESNESKQEREAVSQDTLLADEDPWASVKAAIAHGLSEDFLVNGREQPELGDEPQISDDDWPLEGELPEWLRR